MQTRRVAVMACRGWVYGSGLRLTEALELLVKDIDFDRGEIRVRDRKGRKDWVTMFSRPQGAPLQEHLRCVRSLHQKDLVEGAGRVVLPDALGVKQVQNGVYQIKDGKTYYAGAE